jgi:hypothetical protein
LVYTGNPDLGACSGGGKHTTGASASYAIRFGQGGPGMQALWRWCLKCQGMVFAGNPDPGACPAGSKHDTHLSAAYALTFGDGGQGMQPAWRWCQKCQAMTFAGSTTGEACPAGGLHDVTHSSAYAMLIDQLPTLPVHQMKPQLFLAESYQLSTFRGGLIRGDLITTGPSLLPHQEFTGKVIATVRTQQQINRSSTVLDEQSEQSSQAFNQQIKDSADAKFAGEHYDYGMKGNFHGEGSVGFGSASADAHVDASGSTNDVRQELANSVASAIDNQVSQANQARRENMSVASSSTEIDKTTQTETVVQTKNDSDRVENFGIYQVKEEHIAILSLVDVEVAFQNTVPDSDRKVSLFQLDSLLEDVIAKPEERSVIKAQIRNVLEHVRDYQGQPQSIIVEDPGKPSAMMVNKRLESRYELKNADGSVRRLLSVPGVIVNAWSRQLLKAGSTLVLPIV